MSAAELQGIKLNLISWINNLGDKDVISFLEGLRISTSKKDWWHELSNAEKKEVLAGLKDAENGNLLNSEDFWRKLKNA